MNQLLDQTLATIVKDHNQASLVFEKYNLDFCCKGKRTLKSACVEKALSPEKVADELEFIITKSSNNQDFNSMSLAVLIDHIVKVHHTYAKLNLPQIYNYVERVSEKHGHRFPFIQDVLVLVLKLRAELEEHMKKEEKVLFPWIKQLEATGNTADQPSDFGIASFEEEHQLAGSIMDRIRKITNDYQAPEDGCTTFRLSLSLLHAFELDLHQHVHLENNILFPKAIALLASKASL
jgi:regulator of cell morphogenesis and NO signaling